MLSRAATLSLSIVALFALTACKEQIIHNLDETDANRFLTGLHEARIDAEKVKQADGQWALAVESSEAIRAIKALEERRLFRASDSVPLEKSSVISSREDQRFRFERALSREIENTLTSIDGVLEARVHLNMAPTDPLFGTPVKNATSSASVLLVVQAEFGLKSEEIALLVAGASGIDQRSVSVLLNRSQRNPAREAAAPLPLVAKSGAAPSVAGAPAPKEVKLSASGNEEGSPIARPTVWALLTSNLGLQVICSILILIGGVTWVILSRRRAQRALVFSAPLLKSGEGEDQ